MIISALKTLTWATFALAVVSAGLQAGVGGAPRAVAVRGEPTTFTSGSKSDDGSAARRSQAVRNAPSLAPAAAR